MIIKSPTAEKDIVATTTNLDTIPEPVIAAADKFSTNDKTKMKATDSECLPSSTESNFLDECACSLRYNDLLCWPYYRCGFKIVNSGCRS